MFWNTYVYILQKNMTVNHRRHVVVTANDRRIFLPNFILATATTITIHSRNVWVGRRITSWRFPLVVVRKLIINDMNKWVAASEIDQNFCGLCCLAMSDIHRNLWKFVLVTPGSCLAASRLQPIPSATAGLGHI